jgi:hypothetical protein
VVVLGPAFLSPLLTHYETCLSLKPLETSVSTITMSSTLSARMNTTAGSTRQSISTILLATAMVSSYLKCRSHCCRLGLGQEGRGGSVSCPSALRTIDLSLSYYCRMSTECLNQGSPCLLGPKGGHFLTSQLSASGKRVSLRPPSTS